MKRTTAVTPPAGKPFAPRTPPLFRLRNSKVHGKGVFAARRIRKGTRILEYLGDRISHREADQRYEDHDENDNHTFLFIVDRKTVIDAEVGGNVARFINHACDPNCESLIENGRVFIEALRTIRPGEELGYNYEIGREKDDPDNVDEIYACRCGSPRCRGTMLWPPKRRRRPRKAQRTAGRKRAAPGKSRRQSPARARPR